MTVAQKRVKLGKQGRIVIPAVVRKELGLEPGEELLVSAKGSKVELQRREDLLREIQAEWRSMANGRNLVDELIEERRREFANEEKEHEEWRRRSSTPRR